MPRRDQYFVVHARVRARVCAVGTSEFRRRKAAEKRLSYLLSSSGLSDHTICTQETLPGEQAPPLERPRHSPHTLKAAIAFARATWLNDGAEGETVHLLCDELDRRLDEEAEIKRALVQPLKEP
jgi:hypothetical protein